MNNKSWSERDLKTVWRPCTQIKDHEGTPLIPIQRGKGIWLYDFDSTRYLDTMSSWWVNLFGHAHAKPLNNNWINWNMSSWQDSPTPRQSSWLKN